MWFEHFLDNGKNPSTIKSNGEIFKHFKLFFLCTGHLITGQLSVLKYFNVSVKTLVMIRLSLFDDYSINCKLEQCIKNKNIRITNVGLHFLV